MKRIKIAVVGSRDYNNYEFVAGKLDKILSNIVNITIVSGGAKGVDSLAARYAKERGHELIEYLPDWEKNGKSAGIIRNNDIINESNFVVAFHKNNSRGTAHSVGLARSKNIPIRVVTIN